MYLTQMGEIPLLTREQEIALAKKIELTRMAFRRQGPRERLLHAAGRRDHAGGDEGRMPFDRTMKISTTESMAKATIIKRLPANLATVRKLLELNRRLGASAATAAAAAAVRQEAQRAHDQRRRRAVTLLEELSLRTSRISR
jgi:RNA polymerase primary sigma factor